MIPLWPGAMVAGLLAGSFLGTLVVRLPAGVTLGGRSRCDGCRRRLGVAELVPLVSWIAVRGRCRGCTGAINAVHPIMEGGCALVAGAALAVAPDWTGVAGAVFGWLLLALALLDLRHFWLPDALVAPVAGLGLLAGPLPLADRAAGGVAGFVSLWVLAAGYRALRGREGMGRGDPKLFGAIGLWCGWQLLPIVALGACVVGLAAVGIAALGGRSVTGATALPFGALLAIAAFPAWLWVVA